MRLAWLCVVLLASCNRDGALRSDDPDLLAAGSRLPDLTVRTDQGGPPDLLFLPGCLAADPASVSFAATRVGATSPVVPIHFDNRCPGTVTVSGVFKTGGAAGSFVFDTGSSEFPHEIPPGGSMEIDASFEPRLPGPQACGLSIESDAPGVVMVALSGTGL